ncbi:hypothetical protein [Methylobacterium sp. P1-11]|uniref:hypothetical protein n=1 Tax=Methylobacterium sp. P1-11 TaxID=2024616 RepID=UPI0011F08F86|nr:hypothetical protein [Methylobacterium sp. P1-11]
MGQIHRPSISLLQVPQTNMHTDGADAAEKIVGLLYCVRTNSAGPFRISVVSAESRHIEATDMVSTPDKLLHKAVEISR